MARHVAKVDSALAAKIRAYLDTVPPDAWQRGGRRPHFSECRLDGIDPPLTKTGMDDGCESIVAAMDPLGVYGVVRAPKNAPDQPGPWAPAHAGLP